MLQLMESSDSPDMRIQISITGLRATRVRQLMSMNGFKSENEAVQYLVNRGLESCSGTIRNWDLLREVHERTLSSQSDLFSNMAAIINQDVKND